MSGCTVLRVGFQDARSSIEMLPVSVWDLGWGSTNAAFRLAKDTACLFFEYFLSEAMLSFLALLWSYFRLNFTFLEVNRRSVFGS
jgi:hypothetical protein